MLNKPKMKCGLIVDPRVVLSTWFHFGFCTNTSLPNKLIYISIYTPTRKKNTFRYAAAHKRVIKFIPCPFWNEKKKTTISRAWAFVWDQHWKNKNIHTQFRMRYRRVNIHTMRARFIPRCPYIVPKCLLNWKEKKKTLKSAQTNETTKTETINISELYVILIKMKCRKRASGKE